MLFSIRVYSRLIAIRIRAQMQYRGSFLFDILTVAFISGANFLTVALVLIKFDGISGWSVAEVAFLFGMVETGFGVMDMVFSGFDPPYFGAHVRQGTFDQMLLRPVAITAQVFGSEFVIRRIGRILQGLIILIIAFRWLNINWTIDKLFYIPIVLISQVCFFGGLFILGAAITFWTVESIEAINIFTYGGTEMMSYPMEIFPGWMIRFFSLVLPAIFLNYFPALYFLNKPNPFDLPTWVSFLAPIAGFGVLLAGLAFWRYGIRHYQSTGS